MLFNLTYHFSHLLPFTIQSLVQMPAIWIRSFLFEASKNESFKASKAIKQIIGNGSWLSGAYE